MAATTHACGQGASRFVPLYRDRYRAHVEVLRNLRGPDDLWRLPAVSKEDYVRLGPAGYVDEREERPRLVCRTTSGSLGRALDLFATPAEATVHSALLWSGWMGRVTKEDRMLCLAAPHLEMTQQYIPNTFLPTRASAEEARARVLEFRPTVVVGSVEAIALLARDLRQHDVGARRAVRVILPFGQTLTPQLEAMIREGFDGEIFNLYGAAETFWIAQECEHHNGLHVIPGRVIVQIARLNHPDQPAGPGELGEVIVTSLARWTTPLIRYRLGDVAAFDSSPCPCGRPGPRLRSLEGRIQDFLIARDGSWVSPGAVQTDLAYGQEALLDHRIVQETPELVRAWIVPGPGFGEGQRRHIVEALRHHLGSVCVEVELVEEVPRDPSGKRRRVHRDFGPSP